MSVEMIDGIPFKHALSALGLAHALSRVVAGRKKREAIYAEIKATQVSGSWLGLWKARCKLFQDDDIKLLALIRANKRMPAHRRWAIELCLTNAETLNPYAKDDEIVRVHLKPKSGGYRAIQSFGPRKKAAQLMAIDAINPFFKPRPHQHSLSGVHSAIAAVKGHINSGFTHYAHYDVKNHFGGFVQDELSNALPVEPELVEHVALSKGGTLAWAERYAKTHKGLPALPQYTPAGKSALLGLAQGSACSPIIAAYCVARMPWQPPAGVAVVNYSDNYLFFGASKNALAEAWNGLKAAFVSAPGGSFDLVLKDVGTVASGLEFMGHAMQAKEGNLKTWPSTAAMQGIYDELDRLDVRLGKFLIGATMAENVASALLLISRYVVLLRSWRAAFHECDDLERFFVGFDESASNWMKSFGVTPEQVEAAVTPGMCVEPDLY